MSKLTVETLRKFKDNYNKIHKEISQLCEKYFASTMDEDWQHYTGWEFTGDNKIRLNYSYEDFWSNTEMYTEWDSTTVTYEELIKFNEENKESNN